jgi:signal transduction histidine kinase
MGIYNLSRTQLQAEIEILSAKLQEIKTELTENHRLIQAEQQNRRELLAVVAQSAGLERAVELTLVNLRSLVPYDLAGLYVLASEASSLNAIHNTERENQADLEPNYQARTIQTFPDSHPLVKRLELSDLPIILPDIQNNSDFSSFGEMKPIHSWIGIPLLVNDRLVGFVSLGSLKVDVYREEDAQRASSFITPLAELIERAIETESLLEQASDLEVISRLSLALGQASSQEDIFIAILEQAQHSFGVKNGAFLFLDPSRSSMVIRFPRLDNFYNQSIPLTPGDPFWQVFQEGGLVVLKQTNSVPAWSLPPPLHEIMLDCQSTLILPLKSGKGIFGMVILGFPQEEGLGQDEIRLIEAVGQIISTTLGRLFTLEALETQLSLQRTRLIEQTEQAAAMQERQRLARELHDSVAQLIYSQVLFAGAGLKVLKNGNHELSEEYLHRIHHVAQQALKEMRLLVFELRPSETLEEGLQKAIERRLESVEKRSNLTVRFDVDEILNLDTSREIALYYIAMEALNNIVKHSGANDVFVSIHSEKPGIRMIIEDNGCGFIPSAVNHTAGMGLVNMQDRANAVGARLEIISELGKGTRIEVFLEDLHDSR